MRSSVEISKWNFHPRSYIIHVTSISLRSLAECFRRIPSEDVENVQFSLDGHDFEIDLSAGNAARLREKLERFVDAGHQVKKQKRGIRKQIITTGVVSKEHTQAIRHWARENGYQVSERGRVPSNVRDAFEAAH